MSKKSGTDDASGSMDKVPFRSLKKTMYKVVMTKKGKKKARTCQIHVPGKDEAASFEPSEWRHVKTSRRKSRYSWSEENATAAMAQDNENLRASMEKEDAKESKYWSVEIDQSKLYSSSLRYAIRIPPLKTSLFLVVPFEMCHNNDLSP